MQQDASPRIFRSLEQAGGRDGFDTIARAAVAEYSALSRPTEAQARRFGRLVDPVWDRLSEETRRALSASLASSPRVPREIVRRLMSAPVEISAPFLATSPCLSIDDLASLEIAGDARMVRLLRLRAAARSAIAASAGAHLAVAEPLPTAAEEKSEPLTDATGPIARPASAEDARETLRRLVRPGARGAPAAGPRAAAIFRSDSGSADLVALAKSGNAEGVLDGLAAAIGLSTSARAEIEADATGRALAAALKAARLAKADAMTVLMMLKPAIGLDPVAFDAMSALYAALDEAECRRRVAPAASARRAAPAPALAPRNEDMRALDRAPAPRQRFGRRKSQPLGASSREAG